MATLEGLLTEFRRKVLAFVLAPLGALIVLAGFFVVFNQNPLRAFRLREVFVAYTVGALAGFCLLSLPRSSSIIGLGVFSLAGALAAFIFGSVHLTFFGSLEFWAFYIATLIPCGIAWGVVFWWMMKRSDGADARQIGQI